MNSIQLAGRLGNSPRVIFENDNTIILGFTLATHRRVYNKTTKNYNTQTDWHTIRAYSQKDKGLAKRLSSALFQKGAFITLVGNLIYYTKPLKEGETYAERIPFITINSSNAINLVSLPTKGEDVLEIPSFTENDLLGIDTTLPVDDEI